MNQKKHLHVLFNYIAKKKWIYLLGLIGVLLCGFSQVFGIRVIGYIIDFFTNGTKGPFSISFIQDEFLTLFFLLVLTRLGIFFGRILWRLTMARQSHTASGILKGNIFNSFQFFKQKDVDETYTKGVLLNCLNSDVNSSKFLFGFTIVGFLDIFFLGITAFIGMVSIDWQLSLVCILSLLIIPPFVKKLSTLEVERYKVAQDELSEFDDLASQAISTIKLQRLTNTGLIWVKKLLEAAESYRLKRLTANFTSLNYFPLMGGSSVLVLIILFILGLQKVFSGSLTVGEFTALESLAYVIMEPLMEIGFVISDWKKGGASLERLHKLYQHPKDKSLTNTGSGIKEEELVISCKNLSFNYEIDSNPIFSNFSLDIIQGEKIGITGPIGAGKTTLINILSGLERSIRGDVLFHGKPFDEYSHKEIRNDMSLVLQRPFLFAASIRSNIVMDKSLSDKEIWSFLEIAGLKEDVQEFKDGLETQLGEWGINLSGGQKQRLTLARSLARNPKVLFLDDCLSAVDTVTENKILRNINEKLKDITIIWVAHRKSTLKYCDKVINLDRESL